MCTQNRVATASMSSQGLANMIKRAPGSPALNVFYHNGMVEGIILKLILSDTQVFNG